MSMMSGGQLDDLLDTFYAQPGDQVFRMERLPEYSAGGQAERRAAWRAWRSGTAPRPDTSGIEKWAEALADEARRGMVRRRVRVLPAHLTDDQLASCDLALPILARWQQTRVLHVGEHEWTDQLDHDYWVIQPAHGRVRVARMVYTPAGEFEGAVLVPDDHLKPYLREMRDSWSAAEDFSAWWARTQSAVLPAAA
jgi:hypothetical protein